MNENLRDFRSCSHHERKYQLFEGHLFPQKVFGQVDALTEWNQNEKISSKLFVHTNSYEVFKDPSNLFLFGRRGTGKTAMISMLDFEIKNQLNNYFHYAKKIDQEDTFYRLTLEIRNIGITYYSKQELISILKEKWIWVIHVSAMVALIEKNLHRISGNKTLEIISSFLKMQRLMPSEEVYKTVSPLSKALDIFSEKFDSVNYEPLKASIALLRAVRELKNNSFEEAFNALIKYLKTNKQRILILIDSKEIYEFNDDVSKATTTSLMDAILKIHNDSYSYNIYSKVSFPSEIYPYLSPSNQGKTRDKGHFIMWRFKDIILFIAKRFFLVLSRKNLFDSEELRKYNFEFKFEHAKNFLNRLLPPTTTSFSEIEIDTLPYIISHTQKKPRQIILLFNIILSLAEQKNIPYKELSSDCIKEGTNARLEDLTAGVLDMYQHIYPDAKKIVYKTFFESNNLITFSELHNQLKEASTILGKNSMTKEDAERLFLEAGIIGIIKSENKITNDKSIIEAIYEYQLKDILTLQSRHIIAVHPMFYQGLNCKVDFNSMVYPKPAEEEKEEKLLYPRNN